MARAIAVRRIAFKVLPLLTVGVIHPVANAQFLNPQQVNQLSSSPANYRIYYGSDPLQFGDLRLPQAAGKHPVAVVIHGGCWKYKHGDLTADLQNMAALSSALTRHEIATWNIEYRQIDTPGGGWTGTFEDVANAIDYLRVLAKPYSLDLNRVVIIGHSAGGHLGTWAAARHRLPRQNYFWFQDPLRVLGVVNLAGIADLEAFLPMQNQSCGEPVITTLIGGSPAEVPGRYKLASPSHLLPLGVKQKLIYGIQDQVVPPRFGQQYAEAARQMGDDVTFVSVENTSHFELIAPGSEAWYQVEASVLSVLKLK
ncbi:MAG: alpha/beta hydrolase [Phormidesmis sp. RL_2_1]|nr:alpha/beta hydrolase [Phormidesmis sp. RL_2_1]